MAKQPTKRPSKRPAIEEMTGEQFDALPDAEKERIFQEIDSTPPEQLYAESRAPNAAARARRKRTKARLGRPRTGEGVRTIALTVEKGLLKRADAYAATLGISRGQLVARGLLSIMPAAPAPRRRSP